MPLQLAGLWAVGCTATVAAVSAYFVLGGFLYVGGLPAEVALSPAAYAVFSLAALFNPLYAAILPILLPVRQPHALHCRHCMLCLHSLRMTRWQHWSGSLLQTLRWSVLLCDRPMIAGTARSRAESRLLCRSPRERQAACWRQWPPRCLL